MRRSFALLLVILVALLPLGCKSGSSWLSKSLHQGRQQSQLEENKEKVKQLQVEQGTRPDYDPKQSSDNYNQGYQNGFSSGFSQGEKDGSEVQPYAPTLTMISSGSHTYDQGYIDGYSDGYDAGFREGTLGVKTTEPSAPAQEETGDAGDWDAGHEAGFKVGYVQGKNDWVLGYGYYDYTADDDVVEQYTSDRGSAYEEGWREGYKDGYVQAWQEQEGG